MQAVLTDPAAARHEPDYMRAVLWALVALVLAAIAAAITIANKPPAWAPVPWGLVGVGADGSSVVVVPHADAACAGSAASPRAARARTSSVCAWSSVKPRNAAA